MTVAIMNVIVNHFKVDGLQQNTQELLEQYEGMVGNYDPFSIFEQLEGIGLDEDEFVRMHRNNETEDY